jgi:hypothetical protein
MMNNMTTLKYWSWIGVFRVDSLLVSASLAGLPLNCKTSLRRGFLFYTHFEPLQNLSIWVVIKTLRHLCVIFNYGPDDCQGIPVIKEELMSLTLREASKDTLQAENKTWHYYSLPLAAKRLGTFRVYPSL